MKVPESVSSRVAVDANPATRAAVTGTELYAREVCIRLAAAAPELEFTFYAARPGPPGLALDITVLPMRRLWSQLRLPAELARQRPRLMFAPAHVVPFLGRWPALTVVHDLAYEHFPDAYPPQQRAYLRLTTRWAEHRCERLIAVSEATRRDLAELHDVDPARVTVVHPGLARRPRQRRAVGGDLSTLIRLGLGQRPFALHVGRVEARKNQLAALHAVERLPGLLLVAAGQVIDQELATRLRDSGRAVVLGRVDDRTRELLYRNATALVFPSLYEGFGFPVLEAMRAGLPVVTVRTSSLPEVGGDAALYAEGPADVEGLAAQLARVLEDGALRRRLAAAGRRRAASFTWDRTVAGVTAVIRELVA